MNRALSVRRAVMLSVALLLVVGGVYSWARDRGPSPQQIAAGRALFLHDWTVKDPLAGEGDGLGPVFNATSCAACHSQGGIGGGGGNEHNVLTFEVDPDRHRTEVVSHVVHTFATSDDFQETHETVRSLFPVIPGGVRVINGCSVNLADHNPVLFQEVNSPPLFGAGLLDEISDLSVVFHNAKRLKERVADEFRGDYQHNGSGFARSHGGRIGKFGWKGQFVTVEDFVAAACAMELGLTNPHKSQPIPRQHNEDHDAKLDMTKQQLDQLVAFVKSLPRPEQVLPEDPVALQRAVEGEKLFHQIRCTDCHVKDLGDVEGVYTDFQLYSLERRDFGGSYGGSRDNEDLEFERPLSVPLPEEWKTPPLWGVADSAPYFHDGQSQTLHQAIQRHFGHAALSRSLYNKLPKDQRKMVVEFLQTLRAPQ